MAQARSDRRVFLRWLGLSGLTAVPVTGIPSPVAADPGRTQTAYRRSARGRRACGACRGHAANRYYRTPRAASQDPAHRGCNCTVVAHPLPTGTFRRYFHDGDIYDVRWLTAPGESRRAKEAVGAAQR